ncbi:MAG: murein hydrolase activator EnvC family protein [Panacagrimonas sp.]
MLILCASLMPLAGAVDKAAPSAADLDRLRERIGQLDQELSRDSAERDRLVGDLEDAERDIAAAANERRKADAEVALAQRELAAATAERGQAEQALARSRVDLAKALRASYVAGSGGRLQGFFLGYDVAATVRIDAGTEAIARAIDSRIRRLRETAERILAAEVALVDAGEALKQRRKLANEALTKLQQAQGERRDALSNLTRRTADRATELTRAKSEEARLQKLLDDLRQALRDSPMKFEKGVPLKSQRGRLPWPLRGPLLAKFGTDKAGGPLNWSGWWIAAPQGAPVRAVADGRAVYVGFVQRYGLVVILDHPGEYLSLYGHVLSSSVEVGESIAAGSTIAAAGNSGGHEQSGVYFEIRQGTEPVDPAKWLVP